jgi:Na+/melibiose symporter-like transporter
MWVYLAWTLIMIPYQALSAEVSQHAHVKTYYTASREGFAVIGVITVLVLPFVLDDSQDYQQLFRLLYPQVSISLTLALAVLLWRLRLLQPTMQTDKKPILNLQAWRLIWTDQRSRRLLPAYFLNSLANALPATLFLFFVEHYLQLNQYMGVLLLGFFLSGILALPLWVRLAKRFGKYSAWRISMLSACLSFIWVFSLAPSSLWGFALICLFSGLSVAADVALPASIQADIAQDLSSKNGNMSGVLFAVWGMLTKLALALAVGLALPALGWLGWEQQSPASLQGLLWLYAGAPVALKLVALYWLRRADTLAD